MTVSLKSQDITHMLVRPRFGGNIGSASRVLKNMGFKRLVLVRPGALPAHPEARRMAVGAADLLEKAEVFETLEEALEDVQFVVGTSRRTGKNRQDFVDLPDLAKALPKQQRVAILYGAEERGMTNKELSRCHMVCTIPSAPDFPSLNLAQSVAVVSYQLRLSINDLEKPPKKKQISELSPMKELEGMYEHLEKILTKIRFLEDDPSFHMMRSLRGMFGKAQMTSREVRIIRGICRQMEWAVKHADQCS